jgi:hypothetical protein
VEGESADRSPRASASTRQRHPAADQDLYRARWVSRRSVQQHLKHDDAHAEDAVDGTRKQRSGP